MQGNQAYTSFGEVTPVTSRFGCSKASYFNNIYLIALFKPLGQIRSHQANFGYIWRARQDPATAGDWARHKRELGVLYIFIMSFNLFLTPPRYTPGKDVGEFIALFESYCNSVKATDEVKRHLFLTTIDDDLRWSVQEKDSCAFELTYEEIIKRARKHNTDSSRIHQLRAALFGRRQMPQESARDFVYALKGLADKAYPGEKDIKNEVLYSVLLFGMADQHTARNLPQQLGFKRDFWAAADVVLGAPPQTHFDVMPVNSRATSSREADTQAIGLIEELKRELKANSEHLARTVASLQADLQDVRNDMRRPSPALTWRQSAHTRQQTTVRCFACGESGHIQRFCNRGKRILPSSRVTPNKCQTKRLPVPNSPTPGMFSRPVKQHAPLPNGSRTTLPSDVNTERCGTLKSLSRFVNVSLNAEPACALVDTGATVSMITLKLWKVIRNRENEEPSPLSSNECFTGVTGNSVHVAGKITANVKLGGLDTSVELYVATGLSHDFILGLDFLQRNRCSVCYESNFLKAGQAQVPLLTTSFVQRSQDICLVDPVNIPPSTEVYVSGSYMTDACGEDVPDFSVVLGRIPAFCTQFGLRTANGLTTVRRNKILVRLANFSDDSIEVPSGTRIALAVPVHAFGNIECPMSDCCVVLGQDPHAKCPCLHGRHPQPTEEMCTISNANTTPNDDHWSSIREGVNVGTELSTDQEAEVWALLRRHEKAFSTDYSGLGRTSLAQHTIETGEARPVRQPPRRMAQHYKQQVEKIIGEMRQQNLIRPSTSPWSSSIVLVKKKSGELRFCVDYRQVNEITKKNSYPIPRVDDSLDEMSGSKFFSTLDLKSGYWQIPMDEQSREKTAFASHMGLYEFNVMPMGLCNSAASFQRLMRIVLQGIEWQGTLAYLDDVIIYGRTFDEHVRRLADVLSRLESAGLTLKPSKCDLFKDEVRFLGHVVSKRGVMCDPEKVRSVAGWPVPKSVKQVRQFVGLTSYYRKFVKDYAKIASPLHKLTEKGRRFTWTDECQQAFATLKRSLTTAPVLQYPDFKQPFILDTDASDVAIGCVLGQVCDGKEHVVAYGSRTLSKAERHYSTTRKELLAVIFATKLYKCYLLGAKFLLRTDHSSLRWLWRSRELYGQCARWVEHLAAYDFDLTHRPGVKHTNADALSRLEPEEEGFPYAVLDRGPQQEVFAIDLRNVYGYDPIAVARAQRDDPNLVHVVGWVERGIRPSFRKIKHLPIECRHMWSQFSRLLCIQGVLFFRDSCLSQGTEDVDRLVVPLSMRDDVMLTCHDLLHGGGHLGRAKTISKVAERFYWLKWRADIEDYCRKCKECNLNKRPSTTIRAPLVPSQEMRPMERIEIDVLGPLPQTRLGYQYVLVACDLFTKYVRAWPMRHQTAQETASILFHRWLTVHGVPDVIHSDRGGNFESKLFAELVRLMGCKKSRTTAYHPAGNGGVERNNRTIISMLRNYVQRDPKRWDEALSGVVAAYNASRHESTGISPHYLLTGHKLRLPADLMASNLQSSTEPYVHLDALKAQLRLAEEVARETLSSQRAEMERTYNKRQHGEALKVGDVVLLENPVVPTDGCRKFLRPYKGPYQIVRKPINFVNYVIRDRAGKEQTVHFNRLKRVDLPFIEEETQPVAPSEETEPHDFVGLTEPHDFVGLMFTPAPDVVAEGDTTPATQEDTPETDLIDDDALSIGHGLTADSQEEASHMDDARPRRARRQTEFFQAS